ncbi:hypothetical protein PMAYCL1PPCAC_25729, partial [Pristionchus mayeri]
VTSVSEKLGKVNGPVRETLEKVSKLVADLGHDYFENFDGMWKEEADGESISSQQSSAKDVYQELRKFLALIVNIHVFQRNRRKVSINFFSTIQPALTAQSKFRENPLEFAEESALSSLLFENGTLIK